MKKLVFLMVFIIEASQLQACSVLYDIQQDMTTDRCEKVFDTIQRTECLRRAKISFEEYEKQRGKI